MAELKEDQRLLLSLSALQTEMNKSPRLLRGWKAAQVSTSRDKSSVGLGFS